jgi:hypothetical protein
MKMHRKENQMLAKLDMMIEALKGVQEELNRLNEEWE